ncbi:MAG: molybdenum cofactor guanylyltransferase [Pyrinomonadaceae bacterium]
MPRENATSRSDPPEGFVLAGGRSRRMGRDKALLPFGGRNFLENASGILMPFCPKVSAVFNRDQRDLAEKLPPGVASVFDQLEDRGPLGGIHAALQNCVSKRAFVLACDLPFITKDVIEKLISCDENLSAAVVPVQPDGRFQPLCAIYRKDECLPHLEEILSKKEDASVRDFLKMLKIKTVRTEDLGATADLFANINSPADLKDLRP